MSSTEPNTLRWPSIQGAIAGVLGASAGLLEKLSNVDPETDPATHETLRTRLRSELKEMKMRLFCARVSAATWKMDGTNVGKDGEGRLYGRSQVIDDSAANYMKVPLAGVLRDDAVVDVKAVRRVLMDLAELDSETSTEVLRFVLCGELMCNKGIYDYAHCGAGGKWLAFGGMIQMAEGTNETTIRATEDRLANKGISIATRADDQDAMVIRFVINERLRSMLPQSLPCVQRVEGVEGKSFRDLILDSSESGPLGVLREGRQEGLVLQLQMPSLNEESSRTEVLKWKNGHEPIGMSGHRIEILRQALKNEQSLALLNEFLSESELEEFPKILTQLLSVYDNDKRIDLQADGLPVPAKEPKKSAADASSHKMAASPPGRVYNEAVKSARSKFDHSDTFFARGQDGHDEYVRLLAEESRNDVAEGLFPNVTEGQTAERMFAQSDFCASHGERVRTVLAKEWKKFQAAKK